jgi:hypothetical protein
MLHEQSLLSTDTLGSAVIGAATDQRIWIHEWRCCCYCCIALDASQQELPCTIRMPDSLHHLDASRVQQSPVWPCWGVHTPRLSSAALP